MHIRYAGFQSFSRPAHRHTYTYTYKNVHIHKNIHIQIFNHSPVLHIDIHIKTIHINKHAHAGFQPLPRPTKRHQIHYISWQFPATNRRSRTHHILLFWSCWIRHVPQRVPIFWGVFFSPNSCLALPIWFLPFQSVWHFAGLQRSQACYDVAIWSFVSIMFQSGCAVAHRPN